MYSSVQSSLALGVTIPALMVSPCTAVSSQAVQIQRSRYEIASSAEQSIALFGERDGVLSMICEIEKECGFADWDGYGALPVSELHALKAKNFVKHLPMHIPMPEVSPEPDGSLSLDWTTSRSRRFSVSIGSSDRLAYAWIDGSDRGHAVARFDSEAIPSRILEGIRSIQA
jgi:hypothetical protein